MVSCDFLWPLMAAAASINPRDHVPLLLRSLCDRGPRLQPDNLVITQLSNGYHTITYREHHVRSLQLASSLSRWGVRIGDRVGSMLWNSAWHLQVYHAVSCMGAVLHTMNLRLGPKDLGFTVQHANDRIIFSDADLLELLGKVDREILDRVELFIGCGADGVPNQWSLPSTIPAAKTVDYEAFLQRGTPDFVWPELPETALHALCYTSGTTGVPKAAAYSHRSTYLHTLASVGTDQLGVGGAHVVLPFVPMFHVLAWGIPFMALMQGTRLVFSGRRTDPDSMLDAMLEWGVQMSGGVPTVWQGLKSAIERRGLDSIRKNLKLRTLICGGSAPAPALMSWFWERLGVEFVQIWGMTETNPLGTIARKVAKYKDLALSAEELFKNTTKAGLPCPGVELRVVSSEDLDKDVPAGQAGELLVKGPWVIAEYFQVNAKEKFHKGWLITGDVAKLDEEGALVISDRSKDVIKSGGEWISSIDLENHIASMEGLASAAVVAVPHPRWDERPVAIVTLAPGAAKGTREALSEKVLQHCLKAFAKFQLPDEVLIWDELPLVGTGKVDKKAIRDRLKQQGYVLPTLRESKL